MIRIYVRRKNEIAGHVFISKSSIKGDKVAILPFIGFVDKGFITEEEWAKSQQTIIEKFELYVTETVIDGRTKLARSMRTFSWKDILKMHKCRTDFKAMGYKTISNCSAIMIEISNCGSMVRYRIGKNGAVSGWKEIHYTHSGRPFFEISKKAHGRTRHYLDEFVKI